MSKDGEVLRLRKELVHAKTQITDLQEELEEKTRVYIKAISDRDQYREKLGNVKESINKVETIVQSQVNKAVEKDRQELLRLREENQLLRKRIDMFDAEKLTSAQREKQLQDKINALTQDLQFFSRNQDMRECMERIERLREERDAKDAKITEKIQLVNELQRQLEDVATENRALRKTNMLPEGFGIDLGQLKLNAEKKIENYTKLIKVLQDDNYKLEEERARLKHMLKQQSMLYTNNQPWDRYPSLTPEQLFKVDQYVLKLQAGAAEEPSDFYKLKKENTVLKAQLEALNSKGFEFAKATIDAFLKELGLGGDSGKLFDKLHSGNEELKKMIRDLLSQAQTGGVQSAQPGVSTVNAYSGRFRPPQPSMGLDGEVSQGYSHKFQMNLEVADRDGRPGLGDQQTKYDVAFLQLQLQECLELHRRREEELQQKNQEVEGLYRRIRDYLLVQDQLYKDFVRAELAATKSKEEMSLKLRGVTEEKLALERQAQQLQELVRQLQSGFAQGTAQARLIELTKQNSLLDVNLLRLTRKYQTLAEQEELLRREYHSREAALGEKDLFVKQRIEELKAQQARFVQELRFAQDKLRLAVPRTELEASAAENEVLKQKNADYIERNSKLAERVARLQTQVRGGLEAEERMRAAQEAMQDLQNEYEVVRKRLERVDSQYAWENAIFNKVVATLKRHRVSPEQAFQEFDENKDGRLTREEFLRGLELLKISNLSQNELDLLIASIDVDSDGSIRYKEFVNKLSRHGVRSRSPEEQILFLLIEAFKKAGIKKLSEAFELFDKKNLGSLSREDFKDVFKSMNLTQRIDEQEVDRFIEHFWRDQKAGIDYVAFLRIFQRYQLRLEKDETRKGEMTRIDDDVIRLKKRVFNEIHSALIESGKSVRGIFELADVDRSNEIDHIEMGTLFDKMGVKLVGTELKQIFDSIDFDRSGKVSLPEFMADFQRTVQKDIVSLLQEERERFDLAQTLGDPQAAQSKNEDYQSLAAGSGKQSAEVRLQTRIAILETREKQRVVHLQKAEGVARQAQQMQLESANQYTRLEKKWSDLAQDYHLAKEQLQQLQDQLRHSIKKDEATRLIRENERLQTDLVETKAALLSYKNMNETVAEQAKGLKLIVERRKDEHENLLSAVRELSAQSEDQKRLGKLHYLVMLSRWQEAALARKYEAALNEARELRKDIINTEQQLKNKDMEFHRQEVLLSEQNLELQRMRKQLGDSKNVFLSLEKAEEFNSRMTELQDEKTALEEQYFEMRTKYRANQLSMDEAIHRAEHAQELLDVLKRSQQSELSDRLINLSEKLQGMKLGEMRATRELAEVKEKNNYLARLLRTSIENVKKLEERVSENESKMHKREEEFRKADNDRMRRFFNSRFDDMPGALNSNVRSSSDNPFSGNNSAKGQRQQYNESPGENQFIDRSRQANRNDTFGQNTDSIKQGSTSGDAKFLEGKVRTLESQLSKALEEIRGKELMINQFKKWQLDDRYLGEEEARQDAIEGFKAKSSSLHEQEAREMADAAAQMVKTLHEMLEQKNEQLRSKEEQIDRLRQQMLEQSEKDGLEIAKLRQQHSLAAGSTLAKLQEIVAKNSHGHTVTNYGPRYEQLTREEMSASLDEKDGLIRQLEQERAALRKDLLDFKAKNQEMEDRLDDARTELEREREHVELRQRTQELERVRTELKHKERKLAELKQVVGELGKRMTEYEIQKSGGAEEQKMLAIQEGLKRKEHEEAIRKKDLKIEMLERSRKDKEDDLKATKVREQELTEQVKKLTAIAEAAKSDLKVAQERMTAEVRQREKMQVQLQGVERQMASAKGTSASALSFEQLLLRNKELENELIFLKCQMKPTVVYNKEQGTFEYISQPAPLVNDQGDLEESADIQEFIASLRKWLGRQENQSLTVRSIFESLDPQNFGELPESKFETALHKIGVEMRAKEKRIVKDALDPRNLGFLRYRSLLRELQGVPMVDFFPPEVVRVAKAVVEARDLDPLQFKRLTDPTNIEMMDLPHLQQAFKAMQNEQFQMGGEEVEAMFKKLTRSQRTTGVTLSITKLSEHVFRALDAQLIERMRDSVGKSHKPLGELFARYDSNKDGALDYKELENMLLECQLAFKDGMFRRICESILDPGKRAGRVTFATLKHFLALDPAAALPATHVAPAKSGSAAAKQTNYDIEPSHDVGHDDTTPEELAYCRSGARKILNAFQSGIVDALNARDKLKEGLLSRDQLQQLIVEQKVPELTPAELSVLLKQADRGSKGYIAIDRFVQNLQELATETKGETQLRTFALACKRQAVNLKQELFKYDASRLGKLDRRTFLKALNQLPVTLAEDQHDALFAAGELPEARGQLDIKTFIDKAVAASKYVPSATGKQAAPKSQPGFESWEVEKKYKTKLAALQQQIEESKKETQGVEKQARHWQEMANKLDKERTALQARLVDFNAKPPRAQTQESNGQAQLEQAQQLKDQVFHLQEENTKLEKLIQVSLKAELARQQRDNEKLTERNRSLQEDVRRLELQLGRLLGRSEPLDPVSQREEALLQGERRAKELEEELQAREAREQELSEQLFRQEEKLLDLKFQKETFDLQYARLQKRITDLELYKQASAKLSSGLARQEEKERERVAEVAGTTAATLLGAGPQTKKEASGDSVKLRAKGSKSVAELELLVESLKRVIEKQKTESEHLKGQLSALEQRQEKLKSEKQLRQRIEGLEQELHAHEMKDVSVGEKDATIRKLIGANRQLRDDLDREMERYGLLETKHKDLLGKFTALAKENAKYADMLFTQTTGANMANYGSFLANSEGAARTTTDAFAKKYEDTY